MTLRLNYAKLSPDLFKALADLSASAKTALDPTLVSLVEIRASQLNGCAFCVDMHVKQAKIHGERELRLHHLAVWRESPLFSARERAALAWTEAVTQLPPHGVPDEVYGMARDEFAEKELVDLTFVVMTINSWNRASVAFRAEPGAADKLFGLDRAGLS
ncbi:carboxymuconolactone decarboxylase family protein [Alsobacter sp. SYSU BS001988]|jgi:AhpD family alkylhydroperoxidase